MSERRDAPKRMSANWAHLPSPEQSLLLKRNSKGTVKAIEKIPTPLNEFGIPDSDTMLEIALSTLSSDYVPPEESNKHHEIYPRNRYHNHPSGSVIPLLWRESAFNITRHSQQLHNYFHEIFLDPKEADMDVMAQGAREQAQIDELFFIGQTSIQLSRAKYTEITTDDILRLHLRFNALQDSRQLEGIFYDFLDSYPEGQLGIFPNKEQLAAQPFKKAIRELGVLAGARSLDARRDAAIMIRRVGIA